MTSEVTSPAANLEIALNLEVAERSVRLRNRATPRPAALMASQTKAPPREPNCEPAPRVEPIALEGARLPSPPRQAKVAARVARAALQGEPKSTASADPLISNFAATPFSALPAPPWNPMSEPALAARATHTPPAPPVVHVTIDRIEVRAPATLPRAASAPRARPASPSVTLADYLRHRAAKPGGPP